MSNLNFHDKKRITITITFFKNVLENDISRCAKKAQISFEKGYLTMLSTSAEVASFNRVPIGPRFAANRGALPTRLKDIMPNYFCRGA